MLQDEGLINGYVLIDGWSIERVHGVIEGWILSHDCELYSVDGKRVLIERGAREAWAKVDPMIDRTHINWLSLNRCIHRSSEDALEVWNETYHERKASG